MTQYHQPELQPEPAMTPEEARELTDRIKAQIDELQELITQKEALGA